MSTAPESPAPTWKPASSAARPASRQAASQASPSTHLAPSTPCRYLKVRLDGAGRGGRAEGGERVRGGESGGSERGRGERSERKGSPVVQVLLQGMTSTFNAAEQLKHAACIPMHHSLAPPGTWRRRRACRRRRVSPLGSTPGPLPRLLPLPPRPAAAAQRRTAMSRAAPKRRCCRRRWWPSLAGWRQQLQAAPARACGRRRRLASQACAACHLSLQLLQPQRSSYVASAAGPRGPLQPARPPLAPLAQPQRRRVLLLLLPPPQGRPPQPGARPLPRLLLLPLPRP